MFALILEVLVAFQLAENEIRVEQPCSGIRVYLVGTGGPEYTTNRYGYSTLVQIKDDYFLFDVGRGTGQRLFEIGICPDRIDKIFLTHLHSDHFEGLPNIWMAPWFLFGNERHIRLWGPEMTQDMVDGMFRMFGKDLVARANEKFKREYLDIEVTEFPEGTIVYSKDGVKITSFQVEHDDGNPAFGYCVEYDRYRIVLSGDTTYHPHVVEYGMDADVIVHNVIGVGPEALSSGIDYSPVTRKLATPEVAAKVFSQAKPKLAAFSHICKKGLDGREGDEQIITLTRKAGYQGPLVMGYDRMCIELCGDSITVYPPNDLNGVGDLQ